MATKLIITNPLVLLGVFRIEDYLSKVQFTITNQVIECPQTIGEDSIERVVSPKYDWSLALTFSLDRFDREFDVDGNVTAESLDRYIRIKMHQPYGSGSDSGIAINVQGYYGATFKRFQGKILLDSWDPLGSGETNTLIQIERVFQGDGPLVIT